MLAGPYGYLAIAESCDEFKGVYGRELETNKRLTDFDHLYPRVQGRSNTGINEANCKGQKPKGFLRIAQRQ